MLNPENKARIVNELMTTEEHQGHGCLIDQYGAKCCLAIISDMGVKDGAINPPVFEEDDNLPAYVWPAVDEVLDPTDLKYENQFLPEPVRIHFGFEDSDPRFMVTQEMADWLAEDDSLADAVYIDSAVSLSELNDGFGLSFRQIGKFIELSDL
jgi:hypothetical protein